MHAKQLKVILYSLLASGVGYLTCQAAAPATAQGTIKAKGFLNIGSGTAITDLTGNAKFPDKPDVIYYLTYYEWNPGADIGTPANNAYGDNYGTQVQGYFYPPSTGDYVFYISADDLANLYLSTDDDPANKKLIAKESAWSNARMWETAGAAPSTVEEKKSSSFAATEWPTKDTVNGGAKITLTKGKAYYIETLHKEGGGGDNLAVAVQDPLGVIDATLPIPGTYLSPFAASTTATFTSQPKDAAVMAGTSASFSIGLDIPPGVTQNSIKWTKNGVDIPNSDVTTLSLPVVSADNGAKIKAVVATSKGTLTSSEATLTVATLTSAFTPGVAKLEIYTGIAGTAVELLTSDPKYPNSPDAIQLLTSLSTPNGYGETYGARVSGFLIPPASGDYRFFVYSDDSSQLFLSPDDKEANAVMIAEEPSCCNAFTEPGTTRTSEPQTLVAGKKYAFYALLKEGGGGDYLQVAVRKEGDTTPAASLTPIPGIWLGANAKPDMGDPQIDKQPSSIPQLVEGTPLLLEVAGSVVPSAFGFPLSVQWQKNGQNIAGATGLSYSIAAAAQSDSGTYHAVLSTPNGKSITSSDAVVTVIADKVPAYVTKVSATGSDVLAVTFNEAIDKATAETLANYSLTSGLTVKTATLGGTGNNVVRITLGGTLTSGNQYTLTVTNIKDLFNNVITSLQVPFTARIVTYADVILADKPVVFYQFEETTGQKTKNYGTGGTDGDGLYMMGTGPDDSAPTDAVTEAGPRPPSFLGFGGGNNSGSFGGAAVMLWVDAQKQWLNNLGAFSLEYWVKPANRATDPATFGTRIGIVGQNDAVEYGFIDQNTIQIWTPGGSLNTTYSFPDNTWHHVATIADGKSIKNYFDGVYVNQSLGTTANYGSSTYNVHVGGGGAFDATGNFFTGAIDEVAIFDKAIPADRIAAHFKAGKEGGELPAPEAPKFTKISTAGGKITIEWSGGGTLQAAPTLNGPWQDVTGAASPYTLSPDGTMLFGRIRQ